jgi:hypothetical protein
MRKRGGGDRGPEREREAEIYFTFHIICYILKRGEGATEGQKP